LWQLGHFAPRKVTTACHISEGRLLVAFGRLFERRTDTQQFQQRYANHAPEGRPGASLPPKREPTTIPGWTETALIPSDFQRSACATVIIIDASLACAYLLNPEYDGLTSTHNLLADCDTIKATRFGIVGGTCMKWEPTWNDPFTAYLAPFDGLVGDRRTWTTLTETVRGIIGSGSLICQRIATHSPILSRVQKGAQRVIRLVTGETTKRSPNLDAAHLVAQLRTLAVADLAEGPQDELWLIADGSHLRKPYAKALSGPVPPPPAAAHSPSLVQYGRSVAQSQQFSHASRPSQ
jgi:hypothetical protein